MCESDRPSPAGAHGVTRPTVFLAVWLLLALGALLFALTSRAQPVIQTTAYTRGLLIQPDAPHARAYLGITNNTGLIFFDTNYFLVTGTNVTLQDPLVLTNLILTSTRGLNFDPNIFNVYASTNITAQDPISLTNLTLVRDTISPVVDYGNQSGTLTIDPSLSVENALTLTGDLTMGFANASWADGHPVRLRVSNTGNFSITFTNVAYWIPNGDSTQVTNDWGAGITDNFAFFKDGGTIYASDKEGIGQAGGTGGTAQVFSGNYSGLLPVNVPLTSAALNYDLDSPGILYFWDGATWY